MILNVKFEKIILMINSKELPMILRITQKPNISDVIKPTINIIAIKILIINVIDFCYIFFFKISLRMSQFLVKNTPNAIPAKIL